MIQLARTLLLSACLIAPALSLAQDRAGTAEELLRKSGAWEQLGGVAAQVRAGLERELSTATPRPSASEEQGLSKAVDSAYAPARMRATAARVVADGLADEDITELRRWYESPSGVAITKREEQASTDNVDPRKIAVEGAAVLQRSSVKRRELLDGLVRATKAAQSGVDLFLSVAAATQRGVTGVAPGSPSLSNAQRQELLEAFGNLFTASFALAYEPLTDADLLAYLNFLKSPAGQRFNALGVRALDTAMSEATEDFASRIRVMKDAAPPKSALSPDQGNLINQVREALSSRTPQRAATISPPECVPLA